MHTPINIRQTTWIISENNKIKIMYCSRNNVIYYLSNDMKFVKDDNSNRDSIAEFDVTFYNNNSLVFNDNNHNIFNDLNCSFPISYSSIINKQ